MISLILRTCSRVRARSSVPHVLFHSKNWQLLHTQTAVFKASCMLWTRVWVTPSKAPSNRTRQVLRLATNQFTPNKFLQMPTLAQKFWCTIKRSETGSNPDSSISFLYCVLTPILSSHSFANVLSELFIFEIMKFTPCINCATNMTQSDIVLCVWHWPRGLLFLHLNRARMPSLLWAASAPTCAIVCTAPTACSPGVFHGSSGLRSVKAVATIFFSNDEA